MKCNQCGAEAPAKATFCPQCGVQLGQKSGAARMQAGGAQGGGRDVPEQELWAGSYCPKAMAGSFVGAALLTVLGMIGASFAGPVGWMVVGVSALFIFVYLVLLLFYRRMSIRYQLTTHRLVLQKGILNRRDDRILLVDIDDITVAQPFIDRLLNLGFITLNTSDQTTKDNTKGKGILIMNGIENPQQVGDLIDEARRAERSRRGLYMMPA